MGSDREESLGCGEWPDLVKEIIGKMKEKILTACFLSSVTIKQISTECPAIKGPWKGIEEVVFDFKELSIELGRSTMKKCKAGRKPTKEK